MNVIAGAQIQLEPTSDIAENSMMMLRELCVTLNNTILERKVLVDIMLDASQSSDYAQSSMLAIFHMTMCSTNLLSQHLGDFMLINSSLLFLSSNAYNRLCAAFTPVNDAIVENNELFVFTASSSNSLDYVVGEPQNFQLSIYDDDGKNT